MLKLLIRAQVFQGKNLSLFSNQNLGQIFLLLCPTSSQERKYIQSFLPRVARCFCQAKYHYHSALRVEIVIDVV